MMKLLYVIPSFQHPNVRGPNRHYHLVRELSERHSITLLVLNRSAVSPAALEEMRSYVDQLHLVELADPDRAPPLVSRVPVVGRRIDRVLQFRHALQRMATVFRRLLQEQEYDLIVFHGKSVFPVVQGSGDLPMVVDFCDATSMRIRNELKYAGPLRKLWLWMRYTETRRIERGLLRRTPHVAFIARRDREAILGPQGRAEILPNGVDHEFWHRRTPLSSRPCIVFSGVMSYAPNHDGAMYLLDQIAPQVRQSIPNLEILIVGRDPAPELQAKARQYPNVTVTGFVDDVRPYLESAALFVAPLRYASGTQNKVLEAMSMSLPTVVTSVVADGLRMDEAAEPPVAIADLPSDFATVITRLLQRPSERETLALRGREYVENHFIWSRSAEKLERMCHAALGAQPQRQQPLIGATV